MHKDYKGEGPDFLCSNQELNREHDEDSEWNCSPHRQHVHEQSAASDLDGFSEPFDDSDDNPDLGAMPNVWDSSFGGDDKACGSAFR